MGRCRSTELLRLAANDGAKGAQVLADWPATLVIQNALAAVLYIGWGSGTDLPGPGAYDLVVPGNALMTFPIPTGANSIRARVVYAGAVPAGDTGLMVTITATEQQLAPSVGPLT